MKNIHFIINPIAGNGNNHINLDVLHQYFEKENYHIVVKETSHKKHAIILTKESIFENPDIIVACGGDGTINEVASCLVNTKITLGIIPIGSGNGLASNLKIPKQLHKSLQLIKNQPLKKIDIGCLNNNYFFSNSGLGFSANVIKNYELSKTRKLLGYVKASLMSLKEINHNDNNIEVEINGEKVCTNPLIIFVSNSNELGYHVSLTPRASLQDGLLDVLIVSKLSVIKILAFSILMLFKKHHLLKEVKNFQSNNIKIHQNKEQVLNTQIDGEILDIPDKIINLSVLEKSLYVIAS
ncbi:MAG: diacylglycerol/lipid kinase family protein [Tamlana sp.]